MSFCNDWFCESICMAESYEIKTSKFKVSYVFKGPSVFVYSLLQVSQGKISRKAFGLTQIAGIAAM